MDCEEIRSMLAGYHDGELAPADRARVDEHLRGCGDCSAVLSRLAGIDLAVGVPDPGPEYWDRFNRRVMDRLEGGEAAPAKIARPKRGWARRGLPYFLPAAAAAALLVMVVRQTGMDPFSRTAPPPASPQSTTAATVGKAAPARRPARPEGKKERPPSPERERVTAGSAREPMHPSPVPEAAPRPVPASPSPPPGEAALALREDRMRAESAAPAERGGKGLAAGMADRAASPCEEARSLAGKGRFEDAEAAQRACLERERAPAAQEGGLVFLAELLDRQSRFTEADAVLRETRRQFPASRPLDAYLRQRPEVQRGQQIPGR